MSSFKVQAFAQVTPVAPVSILAMAPAAVVNSAGALKLRPAAGGIDFVRMWCEGQPCRYREDGNDPSAGVGMVLLPNTELIVRQGQFGPFRIVQEQATAKLNVEFCTTG